MLREIRNAPSAILTVDQAPLATIGALQAAPSFSTNVTSRVLRAPPNAFNLTSSESGGAASAAREAMTSPT